MPVLELSTPVPARMPVPRSGAGGRLELSFAVEDGFTRMHVPVQEPPWRAIRAFQNPLRQAVVHLHNVSGGVLSGDSLDLAIEARPATSVQVTSVGATRVYRQRQGRSPAQLFTSIHIGDGAMLEYLPDVVIPFAGSRFRQSTAVSLGSNCRIHRVGNVSGRPHRKWGGVRIRFLSLRIEHPLRRSPARDRAIFAHAVRRRPAVRCPMGQVSLLGHLVHLPHRCRADPMDRS